MKLTFSDCKPAYEDLRVLLRDLSAKTGDFTLRSGKKSDFYVDCRLTTLDGRGNSLLGFVGYAGVTEIEAACGVRFEAVGGLTMGADPVSVAIARSTYESEDRGITAISVRKGVKEHGTKKMVEGVFHPGMTCLVVDDVCTTGGSTLEAIEKIRAEGGIVPAVLVLLDREEDDCAGAKAIEAAGCKFFSIFTRTTLMV